MHTFRLHGLAPEGTRRPPPATFGWRSPRRYGSAAQPAPVPGEPCAPDHDVPDHDVREAPQWVDQDFEEIVFE